MRRGCTARCRTFSTAGRVLTARRADKVGGLAAIRLVQAQLSKHPLARIAYFIGTPRFVYTLVYQCPGGSSAAASKWRNDCDALVGTFTFGASPSSTTPTATGSPTPTTESMGYAAPSWGFSFRYPASEYTILSDQAQFKTSGALGGHDFKLVVKRRPR